MEGRDSWGEGNPLAGAQGVPFPPSPPSFPNALFSGGWSGAKTLPLFPRQPAATVPREREEKDLSKPRKETTAYQTAKARRYGGLLLCTAKQAAEKICRLRWHFCRTSGDRKAALPHSPLRRRQAHKAKEGTTRLPILRLRVRAKRAAATEKGTDNTSRKRNPTTPLRGHRETVDTRKATTAPRRLILQNKARLGGEGGV